MNTVQKYMGLATILLVALSAPSFATSCASGTLLSLVGTSCSIGSTTFSFATSTFTSGVAASQLDFTPDATATSVGFNISEATPGVLSATGSNATYFGDYFTATPTTPFTSFTTDVNGATSSDGGGYSFSNMTDWTTGSYASNQVGPGAYTSSTSGSATPYFNGSFELYNSNNQGTADFSSADFTFNGAQSDPPPTSVPEGSDLGMVGVAVVGLLGAMKRKFFLAAK